MSNAYAFPTSSRYAGLTCISGYIRLIAGAPTIRDGRGFSVTKVSSGVYRITPDDKYFVPGYTVKDVSRQLIAFCDASTISGNFPVPEADCRHIFCDKTNNFGQFVIYFLNSSGVTEDPEYGFTFTLFLSDVSDSGDA